MEINNEETGQESSIPDENAEEAHPMDALLETEEYALETPRRGDIRKGTIARVTESDILVDIGAKSEGVISADELQRLPEEQVQELTVGNEVTVYVLRPRGRDGMILLSITKAQEQEDWNDAERLLETEENFEGEIAGYNKGGLIVRVGHLRGFLPASQVSLSRRRRAQGSSPDERWGKMIDEPVVAKVIEVDRKRNRLILSERAATREAREMLKERLIGELKPGEIRSGHVISLADFGAFIDIGGADGLVHTSELSWKRVNHPSEVLKVGQEVQVKVLDLDSERNRISLSLRELEEDPWDEIKEMFQEGQLVEGTITKLTNFGAFARLHETEDFEVEGLIHISELAERRIEHPSEVVNEGEALRLRVIRVDPERRRIGLSLRKVDSAEYSDLDWDQAMQTMDSPEPEAEAPAEAEAEVEVEVEDFDAELEAEASEGLPPAEEIESGEVLAEEAPVEAESEEQPELSGELEAEDEPVADEPPAPADSEQLAGEAQDEPEAQAGPEMGDPEAEATEAPEAEDEPGEEEPATAAASEPEQPGGEAPAEIEVQADAKMGDPEAEAAEGEEPPEEPMGSEGDAEPVDLSPSEFREDSE